VNTPAASQTGFTCNFNSGLLSGWIGGYSALAIDNLALKVHPVKKAQWDAFSYSFTSTNISSQKNVSFKLKSNFPCAITLALGNSPTKLDAYPVRLNTQGGLCSQEVQPSSEFQTYSFDFTGVSDLNFNTVNYLQFLVNPYSTETGGEEACLWIDDVQIGTHAEVVPGVTALGDFTFTASEGSGVSKTAILKKITDGTAGINPVSISAASTNIALLDHPVVQYTSAESTGTLVLIPKANVIGSAGVNVTLSASGTDQKSLTFQVHIVPNAAPFMDGVNQVKAEKGQECVINLSGISDSNPESTQKIAINISSEDTSVIPNAFVVVYDSLHSLASVSFTPSASVANNTPTHLRIRLKDDGGLAQSGTDSAVYVVPVAVFDQVNKPPVMNALKDISNNQGEGLYALSLTGISDGYPGSQNLTLYALVSDPSVVSEAYVDSLSGSTARLHYRLTGTPGQSTVQVIIRDKAPEVDSNGADSSVYSFTITALPEPAYSWSEDFSGGMPSGWYSDPGVFTTNIQDGALHLTHHVLPFTYPGINVNLKLKNGNRELSLVRNPFLSFRIKAKSTNTNKPARITIALLDHLPPGENGNNAYQISMDKSLTFVPCDDAWHSYTIDYRGAFEEISGYHIDSARIGSLLINLDCTWFQEHRGEFWIDDIKIGEGVDNSPLDKANLSANPVPNQMVQLGTTPEIVTISGIRDGRGGNQADLIAFTDKPNVVTQISVDKAVNGQSQLRYMVGNQIDTANIFVILHDAALNDEIKDTLRFKVSVYDTTVATGLTHISIDLNEQFQTITGFGGYTPSENSQEIMDALNDLNYSVMRIGDAFGSGEPINDNDDPDVLEINNFDNSSFRFDVIRRILAETRCEKFFFTVFSPPAWMKNNKSYSVHIDAQGYADNNKIDAAMYEEYAEYLVGVIRLFKEQVGLDLYAISLQNEPEFNEPYASCKVSGQEFMEIIKLVGQRFEQEGITTKIILPEDICTVSSWVEGKIFPVKNDPEAAQYFDIMAIHNYDPDGIQVSGSGSDKWNEMRSIFESTDASELWMSETSGFVNEWYGKKEKDYMHGTWIFKPGAFEVAGVMHNAFRYGRINAWTGFGDELSRDLKRPNIIGILKQFTAFVEPGSVMIGSQSDNAEVLTLAFRNPGEESLTVLLINRSKKARNIVLQGSSLPAAFRVYTTQDVDPFADRGVLSGKKLVLPPASVTTLYSGTSNAPPTIEAVKNIEIVLTQGDTTITLTGITDGEVLSNQQLSLAYGISNEDIVTGTLSEIQSGTATLTLSPHQLGKATVRITLKDDGPEDRYGSNTREITFYVSVVAFTGLPADPVQSEVCIAPNPVDSKLNIFMNGEVYENIMLVDSYGRLIWQCKPEQTNYLSYNVSSLPGGVYFVLLRNKTNQVELRFVKR
jgi:O-glycosyl hydrolase